MTREDIFALLKDHIVRVVPHVTQDQIVPDVTLQNLGADSVDRADISTSIKDELGVDMPLVEFEKVKNLDGLVDMLYRALSG